MRVQEKLSVDEGWTGRRKGAQVTAAAAVAVQSMHSSRLCIRVESTLSLASWYTCTQRCTRAGSLATTAVRPCRRPASTPNHLLVHVYIHVTQAL